MSSIQHDDHCAEFNHCAECLADWLDAKYRRHKEPEDKEAADLLRAMAQELAVLRSGAKLNENTAKATGQALPQRL